MATNAKRLFILGGGGFVGQQVIREAISTGGLVQSLVRSQESTRIATDAGATTVSGDIDSPRQWINHLSGATAVVDLIQPKIPKRLGLRQIRAISATRQRFTRALTGALMALPVAEPPFLISVSGVDDLAADKDGYISDRSGLRTTEWGWNRIGIPVRKIIEDSRIDAVYAYLGIVYGPGKGFASSIIPGVVSGKWKNFGPRSSQMILIHVEDVARLLVKVADAERLQILNKSLVFTDGCGVEMDIFFAFAASLLGVSAPGRVPRWLATAFAGGPLVEAMLSHIPTKPSIERFPGFSLKFPSYREGLPATLDSLGYRQAGTKGSQPLP